jgi:pimeloyl-ACP methyl ester carboxylesterase
MRFVDHTFDLPLNHADPSERISVYAREVTVDDTLPWLVFLGGGPGFAAPRPLGDEGWLVRALADYRVLLLDQRGAGRSTPVTRDVALSRGADYLTHFRADSIVRDAEAIRQRLTGGEPWSVLGQSFGGFCTVTYLSFAAAGLRSAYITGGLPGVTSTAVETYRSLYPVVAAKNEVHYAAFPDDVEQARKVAAHLLGNDVLLPNGRRLTVETFQSVGNLLGGRDGNRRLHYLLESPFSGGTLSDAFLLEVQAALSWATPATPLYYLLHEPTYAQGTGATSWAAQRVRAEHPEFDARAGGPVYFTGEMIYPWMFDDDPMMRPLRPVADALADRPQWSVLYDVDRLRDNQVPVTAAVYDTDMYVSRELSLRTAATIGNLRLWHTDEHQHDGLRVSNGEVLSRLFAIAEH